MAVHETAKRNAQICADLKSGHSIEAVGRKYGLSERSVRNIDQKERASRGELRRRGRPAKKATAATPVKEIKKAVEKKASKAPAKKREGFLAGRDYVLYHVKRRLPKDHFLVTGQGKLTDEDVNALLSIGVPRIKAEFLARFVNKGTKVSNCSEEYDYTFAAGYREDLKALVVTYARPVPMDAMLGTVKEVRRRGFQIATGRIKKAVTENVVFADSDDANLNRRVLNTMQTYCHKACKFFKDKAIESVYMFTPDNRLVLLETADA